MKLKIREFRQSDTDEIIELFRTTVQSINIRDYSPEQIAVWAPDEIDRVRWAKKLAEKRTHVAEDEESTKLLGFGELEDNGHIDCFYCHSEYQGVGVGSKLLAAIESTAKKLGIQRLYLESSITARPFFESRGFEFVRENSIERQGVELTNFLMEKQL